jgi:alkylated DNA nucleotide flippase Atl1
MCHASVAPDLPYIDLVRLAGLGRSTRDVGRGNMSVVKMCAQMPWMRRTSSTYDKDLANK